MSEECTVDDLEGLTLDLLMVGQPAKKLKGTMVNENVNECYYYCMLWLFYYFCGSFLEVFNQKPQSHDNKVIVTLLSYIRGYHTPSEQCHSESLSESNKMGQG